MSEHNLSAQEFGVLLKLLTVNPWPLPEIDRDRLVSMMDEEARSRDYRGWGHAYSEMVDS